MSNVPYLVEKIVDYHVQNLLEELADSQESWAEIKEVLDFTNIRLSDEWDQYTYMIWEDE